MLTKKNMAQEEIKFYVSSTSQKYTLKQPWKRKYRIQKFTNRSCCIILKKRQKIV